MLPSVVVLLSMVSLAHAQASAQAVASVQSDATSCVDVSVNDQRSLSYACLNQRLASAIQPTPPSPIQLDAVAHAPGNQQVGQFNFSAFSHQMGNSLGKSVIPQRPPPAAAPPLLGVH
ncbi:hypothetical protein [Dyella monticola]|nr:hypothetical protein [Dyella monticola]